MPITPQALARILGTSRAFVRRLIEKGQIATTVDEQGLIIIEQDEAQRVIEKIRADTLALRQATTPEAIAATRAAAVEELACFIHP